MVIGKSKKRNKSTGAVILWLVLAMAAGYVLSSDLSLAAGGKKLPEVISLGTRPAGSSNYNTAVPIATVVSKYSGMKVISEPTGGIAGFAPLMKQGKMELAMTASAVELSDFYTGSGGRAGQPKETWIRHVAGTYITGWVIHVRADSGIRSIKDLNGKRIYLDYPKGPEMSEAWRRALEYHGAKVKELVIASPSEAAQAVVEKKADGWTWTLSSASLNFDRAVGGMVVLGIDPEALKYIRKTRPGFGSSVYPSGYLGHLKQDLPTAGSRMLFTAHKDLDENIVYTFLKTMYAHYDEYKKAFPTSAQASLENIAKDVVAPFHPGTIKYMKEKKLWNADYEKINKKLLDLAK